MNTSDRTNAVSVVIVLAAILGLAAVLRLHDLGGPELQWDEHLALHRAAMPIPQLLDSLNGQSASDVFQDASPPLHHLCSISPACSGTTTSWSGCRASCSA